MAGQDRVSGRLVVFVLFGAALLIFAIVLTVGYRQKLSDQAALNGGAAAGDSANNPDTVRAWLTRQPKDWIKVTQVEGQGFVIYIPCYSSNSTLTFRTTRDSVPGLACDYCDSLDTFAVVSAGRGAADSTMRLSLSPAAGEVKILPVNDNLAQRFPEAPFRDRLLLWIRSQRPDSTGTVSSDTMFFVPKADENEFEVLRAEDENPEGCGGEGGE